MIEWKTGGTKIYQQLAIDMQKEWKACEPIGENLNKKLSGIKTLKHGMKPGR